MRVLFAMLAVGAMGYLIIVHLNENPDLRLADIYSFFTIESDSFATVVLVVSVLRYERGEPDTERWALAHGAAVL